MLKKCNHCNKELHVECFHRCKSYPDGLSPRCIMCNAIMQKGYSENLKSDPDRYEVYRKERNDKYKLRRDKLKKESPQIYNERRLISNENQRKYRHKLRDEFLREYGGECSCCHETKECILSLEHKFGGGNEHRRQVGGSSEKVLRDLKKRGWPKDEYEILCFNCNLASSGGKTCPHKIKHKLSIYLDMDSTLFNFVGRVCKIAGLDENKVLSDWPRGVHEITEAMPISHADFYGMMEKHSFWAEIEPYPWANELYEFCQQIAPTMILTKPTLCPWSASGKVACLQKWRGQDFTNYIITPHKEVCARKGSLLIDDLEDNVKKFIYCDGDAMIFPMMSNSRFKIAHKNMEVIKCDIFSWYKAMLSCKW